MVTPPGTPECVWRLETNVWNISIILLHDCWHLDPYTQDKEARWWVQERTHPRWCVAPQVAQRPNEIDADDLWYYRWIPPLVRSPTHTSKPHLANPWTPQPVAKNTLCRIFKLFSNIRVVTGFELFSPKDQLTSDGIDFESEEGKRTLALPVGTKLALKTLFGVM